MFREPTENERRASALLLSQDFPGSECFRAQLQGVQVRQIDEEGSISFEVAASNKPRDSFVFNYPIPVEGHLQRGDDVINFDLHVSKCGLLKELHVYSRHGLNITDFLKVLSDTDFVSMIIESK